MKTKIPFIVVIGLLFLFVKNVNQSQPDTSKKIRSDTVYLVERERMVAEQIVRRGVENTAVLEAMRNVKRHLFVPEEYRNRAYMDGPLSIGKGQTISQPYIVAYMTEMANPQHTDKVLEIGTGSGYQAAVLAEVVDSVCTIEIIESLGKTARIVLDDLGYSNIHYRIGDGYKGWPEEAPFDIIIVTAAPEEIPHVLIDQLAVGGRMIVPVGPRLNVQYLLKITKDEQGTIHKETLIPVRFVPMVEGGD